MLPNMKFYLVSIVAIFTALGVGIYIGFSIDSQELITDQQDNLVDIVESQFESITEKNKELELYNENLYNENKMKNDYINESYNFIVPEELENKNIAIIETSNKYISSGIGYDLEQAGASITSLTVIKELDQEEIVDYSESLISTKDMNIIENLKKEGKIEFLGEINSDIDAVVLCGGSTSESDSRVIDIDKVIIDTAKQEDVVPIGVEKSTANNSYVNKYKEYGITTIDNIDTKMGKVALVLAVNNREGNFGIKGTAETILPVN